MKKTISLLVCILVILGASATAFGSSGASAWATQTTVKRGESVSVYVNLSTTETVSGLGVSVGYDRAYFEYESSAWTVANKVSLGEGKDFDPVLGNGAVLISPSSKPNGEIFCITLRVKGDAPLNSSTVSFGVKVGSEGETVNTSVDITVSCNHSWGGWTTISEPTCTEIGQQERVCSICGTRQQSYIDAKGHDYSDWETTKEASCTESGEQVRTCSVCGGTQARTVAPLGHTLGDDANVTKEATCVEHGEATGTCTVCGQSVTVSTPLAAHKYGDWYTIIQATCTEKGEREHECSVCGYVERQKSLPLGHDFSQGTVVTPATIYSTGLFEAKCTRCGVEGSIISPCSYNDEETGIYLETEEDVFPVGSVVKVKTLESVRPEEKEVKTGIQKYIAQITDYFKNLIARFSGNKQGQSEVNDYGVDKISSSYDLYEIKAVNNDGDMVQQNGKTVLTFQLPEGFGRNTAVYSIDEKGIKTELPVIVDMEKRTVTASSDLLYVFAVANMDSLPEKNDLSMPAILHYIIEGLLLLFLIIACCVSAGRRKKLKAVKRAEKTEKTTVSSVGVESGIEDTHQQTEELKQSVPDRSSEASASSSLRDEINEALGDQNKVTEPPEEQVPEKPKKPTLDDIFGESKN